MGGPGVNLHREITPEPPIITLGPGDSEFSTDLIDLIDLIVLIVLIALIVLIVLIKLKSI